MHVSEREDAFVVLFVLTIMICRYCGSSLSRVGMDFRLLTHSVFEQSIVALFQHRLDSALFFFSESLRTHDWKLDAAAEPEMEEPPTSDSNSVSDSSLIAALLRHPPIAQFANELLEALNQLRYCATTTVAESLVNLAKQTLRGAQSALEGWSTGEQETLCDG